MLGGMGRAVAVSGSGWLLAVVLATSRHVAHSVVGGVKGQHVIVLVANLLKELLGSRSWSLTGRLAGCHKVVWWSAGQVVG